jgi:tetratricopeptide (TPR) repeat protein
LVAKQLTLISKYFEKALKVYEIGSLHKPELARTLFKLSELYTAKGESEKARSTLREAWRLRNGVLGGHEFLEVDDLKESHFDEIIEYWSR